MENRVFIENKKTHFYLAILPSKFLYSFKISGGQANYFSVDNTVESESLVFLPVFVKITYQSQNYSEKFNEL